jgi:hypothetical protein
MTLEDGAAQAAPSPRRKWTAIAVATLLLMISFWSLVIAFVAGAEEDGPDPAAPFSLGIALVPFVFAALAFLSRRENAPVEVLKAMGMWLLVGLTLGLVTVVLGLVAGYGVGGMFTLRAEEVHRWRPRLAAIGLASVYVLVLLLFAPGLGIVTGSIIPFVALGFADQYSERKAAAAAT